jgi:F-type H+-transporting ATPase subunit gamma
MQLIQMRQQIKAIESIKKITHAMRLISMSGHSQLSHKAPFLENYKNELFKIIEIIESIRNNQNINVLNHSEKTQKNLIILIGTQKGLAGTFNISLFHFLEKEIDPENYKNYDFITVGKKATDYIKKYNQPISNYDNFTISNLYDISTKIFENIKSNYANVIIYSNYPKSFFSQVPQKYILLPFKQKTKTNSRNSKIDLEKYIWEQPIEEIYAELTKNYLYTSIQSLLFNSLFAEQAARFQSMDSATRNAEELLTNLKLQYNKIRQMKITKEITELSATLR